jgi:hypothetical protein
MSDDRDGTRPDRVHLKGPNKDESSSQSVKRKRDQEESEHFVVPNDGPKMDEELDQEFADRYTSKDDEYTRLKSQPLSKPPISYSSW